MTLYWIPLESLEERYTADWARWFPQVFNDHDVDFHTIEGEQLTDKIEQGEFLDICGRPYYAMSQISQLVVSIRNGMIKGGDTILFADLWHHGIESLFYIRDLMKLDIEIYGVFHAGSYDPEDFLYHAGTEIWANKFEESIVNAVDGVFVGSEWSKELLTKICDRWANRKIHVTGLPIDYKTIRSYLDPDKEKKPNVVFPHRFAPEKGVIPALVIMQNVFQYHDTVKLIITTGRDELSCRDPNIWDYWTKFKQQYGDRVEVYTGLSKPDYYRCLADQSVMLSTAKQETFGYGTVESMVLGVTPVCPDRLSYPDTLQRDQRFMYKILEEAVDKILNYLDNPIDMSQYAEKYSLNSTIGKMLEVMGYD